MPGGDGALGTKTNSLRWTPTASSIPRARDSKGNVLSLKSGVTMTLYIPVPNDRLAMAPSEVGLWAGFDENAWVQDIGPNGTPTMLTRKNTSFTCRDKQAIPATSWRAATCRTRRGLVRHRRLAS